MAVLRFPEGESAEFSQGEVYFIGNATTVIRFGGITILTDPAFLHKGDHVDLGHGMWARREAEPACQVGDLPPIDLVILSHYHGDHFEYGPALEVGKDRTISSHPDAGGKVWRMGAPHGQA